MTLLCRIHPQWEGEDIAKIIDHLDKDHPELLAGIPPSDIAEYRKRYKQIVKQDIYHKNGRKTERELLERIQE